MSQNDFKSVIVPLKKLAREEPVYNRFLGYSYGKIGDTINANKVIDTIREKGRKDEINYMTSVVFAGMKMRDSVLYYIDPVRNNQTRMLKRELDDFFSFLKSDSQFNEILNAHGLEFPEEAIE